MISCIEYDYIEFVCMYRYPIKLTMKSGLVFECTALDTQRNESRAECIRVRTDGIDSLVELSNITKLEVCVVNPHFDAVSLNSNLT